jgi:predicted neutral ceramidase superfamily lipid hydrolase
MHHEAIHKVRYGQSIDDQQFFLLFTFIVSFFCFAFAIRYVGLSGMDSVSSFNDYVSTMQSNNLGGVSSLDISAFPLPLQLLLYMFLPLFTPPFTPLSLIASVENLSFVVLFAYLLVLVFTRPKITPSTLFLSSYSALSLFCLAITTSNTGIALRQKWMFFPALIILTLIMASKPSSFESDSDSL